MDDLTQERKKLEARREARRKRILLNAENRIKLITGSSEEMITKHVEIGNEENISKEIIGELEQKTIDCIIPATPCKEKEEIITNEKIEFKEMNQKKSVTSRFEHFNILLVIVAILTSMFSNFGFNYFLNESVLMPFLLIEIVAIVFKSTEKRPNSMFHTILLLSNINPTIIYNVSLLMTKLEIVVKDFCLYFFTFLIFHFCYECCV